MSVYQSILARTSEQDDPDYWGNISGLTINYVPVADIDERMRTWWKQAVSLSPRQIRDVMVSGYDDRVTMNVDINPNRMFRMSLMWDQNMAYNADVTYDTSLHPRVTTSKLSIPAKLRGQGTGKKFVRNFMELHNALGASKFLFSAGDDNGAYTWASMGAHLDIRPIYKFPIKSLSQQLIGRFDIARSFLPQEIHGEVRDRLNLRNKDDLATLVRDFRHVMVPSELAPDMNDVTQHILTKRMIKFLEACEPESGTIHKDAYKETRSIGFAFKWAAQQGLPGLSLPRYLLTRTEWPGIVDFDDMDQMKQVGDYVGGWKTIRPVENPRPVLNTSSAPANING